MFNKKCGLLLTLLLLLVSVSGVCATDNNTGSLTTVEDNSLELNNTLCGSDDVDLTNNETTNTVLMIQLIYPLYHVPLNLILVS